MIKLFYSTKRILLLWILLKLIICIGIILCVCIKNWTGMGRTNEQLKYILLWPSMNDDEPEFIILEEKDDSFTKNGCEYTNCYVIDDIYFFKSVKYFDAVIFNGVDIITQNDDLILPNERSLKQKYILSAVESSAKYPVCDEHFNAFFNWTWTYKLHSDFVAPYMLVYDLEGTLVGPTVNVRWLKELNSINDELKLKLSKKTKTAVWFVFDYLTESKREDFMKELYVELARYDLTVDVYRSYDTFICPKEESEECNKFIEDNYFFYFAFEDFLSNDYVTEKLTTALNNYAVPVVFGGANYSRFVPESAYLDAKKLGAKRLARKMSETINNKTMLYNFFRWHNHYKYTDVDTARAKDVCKLCAMLNDKEEMAKVTILQDFALWWNEEHIQCI